MQAHGLAHAGVARRGRRARCAVGLLQQGQCRPVPGAPGALMVRHRVARACRPALVHAATAQAHGKLARTAGRAGRRVLTRAAAADRDTRAVLAAPHKPVRRCRLFRHEHQSEARTPPLCHSPPQIAGRTGTARLHPPACGRHPRSVREQSKVHSVQSTRAAPAQTASATTASRGAPH